MSESNSSSPLRRRDIEFLERKGIREAEAHAQLQRLTQSPATRRLDRACAIGEGILAADDELIERALDAWQQFDGARRFEKWIPASGAASRMFSELLVGDEQALVRLARELERFAFAEDLLRATDGDRDPVALATALVDAPLGYGELPKALIPFHRYPEGPRTAFEEHVAEAQLLGNGEPILTFTVSAEHRPLFEQAAIEQPVGPCRIHLSEQGVASSTLAWDAQAGDLVRDADGRPLLRPGGHGALLGNLNRAAGSHLFVRNIDNIQPASRHAEVVRWKQVLAGLALYFSREIAAAMRELAGPGTPDTEPIVALLGDLGLAGPIEADPEQLQHWLDRPLRVCGVVANDGEPGGGPFWVQLPNGEVRPQIVESAEVDRSDRRQTKIWEASTYFNPVDIACVLERGDGSRYHLPDFADPSAVFVNTRSVNGRDAGVLERPGLWNGGMAYWHTVLVEVPEWTFAPVKSVFDLLRPEHQPEDMDPI